MKHDPETVELLDEIERHIGVRLDSIGVPPHNEWMASLVRKLDARVERVDRADTAEPATPEWVKRMRAQTARSTARIDAARAVSAASKTKATKR